MPEPKTFVFVRERIWESWARDSYSFTMLLLTAWFNATFCSGSDWLYAAISILWLLWLIGKAAKHRREMTPAEARAWLDAQFPVS